jgi:hypothetical protein
MVPHMRYRTALTIATCLPSMLLFAGCSSSGNPLASLTANQIASKAITNFRASSSVHLAGSVPSSGQVYTVDLTLTKRDCSGTFAIGGAGTVQIIVIGATTWIKGSESFWTSSTGGGMSQADAAMLDDKYVKAPTSQVSGGSAFCSLQAMTSSMSASDKYTKGQTVSVDGQQALELHDTTDGSSVYVTISATPEVLRASKGSYHIDFTQYNATNTFSPPPASQVLDLSKLEG